MSYLETLHQLRLCQILTVADMVHRGSRGRQARQRRTLMGTEMVPLLGSSGVANRRWQVLNMLEGVVSVVHIKETDTQQPVVSVHNLEVIESGIAGGW